MSIQVNPKIREKGTTTVGDRRLHEFCASFWSGPRDSWLRLTVIGRANVGRASEPGMKVIAP